MKLEKKSWYKTICLILVFCMAMPIFAFAEPLEEDAVEPKEPVIIEGPAAPEAPGPANAIAPSAAEITDFNRPAVYTAEEGNIARLPFMLQLTNATETRYNPNTGAGVVRTGINANFCNDSYGVPSIQVLRVNNGLRPATGTSNGYLSWAYTDTFGVNNRLYFVLNWSEPYTIYAARCDWWTDSNVSVPNSEARIEWLDGTVWREVTNMRNPVTNQAVTNIGTLGMGNWNPVTFDPVTTTQLRLRLHRTGTITSGIGVGEWEVFGYADDPDPQEITGIGPISGNPTVTNTLTAGDVFSEPGPTTASVTYQWQRADSADGGFAAIPGATASTYTLVAADEGKFLRVVATGAGAASGSATSAPVGPVAEVPPLREAVLITGDVLEIEYSKPVLTDEEAQAIFDIYVNGAPVEWEFLSYFDFGSYATRGGVVNIRLAEPVDAGRPREQRRDAARFNNTQNTRGPAAAATIGVKAGGVTKTPTFRAFYEEVNQSHMSMMYSWAATGAGNGTLDNFSATTQTYTTNYVCKMMSEGTNSFIGRSEYHNLTAVRAGMSQYVVGGRQSVYEAPEWRELYKAGETTDTYTRTSIPGTLERPYIVTTADEVMRHNSVIDANGNLTSASGLPPARPRSNDFSFMKDFFDLYFTFGVMQGSLLFPLGQFNEWDEYRYDVHLERAYDNAVEMGLWPGTIMMDMTLPKAERLKAYYVYGALVHAETRAESPDGSWQYDRFPVNTRYELYNYDHQLYRVMCGLHGRALFFSGTPNQTGSFTNDSMKNSHPWFWRSQPDNFFADPVTSEAAPYPPLAISEARIISNNQLLVTFNRPVATITNVSTAGNWRIYRNGTEVTPTLAAGYLYNTITLSASSLDNGRPYGRAFSGFTRQDVDERCIAAGGWLANNQAVGANALQRGEYVSLQDAIDRGAGPNGTIEVAYTGTASVQDFDGNNLPRNVRTPAIFWPWEGNAYRSALTGLYIVSDTEVELGTMMAAAHLYEATMLLNNDPKDVTYKGAGGLTQFHQPGFTHASANNSDVIYRARTGQRLADSATSYGGRMTIMAGAEYGHHAAMQPNTKGQINSTFHVYLYVEGWGGTTFQCDEVMLMKDTMLTRYKNENLALHEGGHGWDSWSNSSGRYSYYANTDMRNAHASAVAAANGRRYYDRYNASAYLGAVTEMFSTGTSYWGGAMREQFQGVHDGTWTPINSREEFFRYDPYCFEAFKRISYNGDLGMWYYDKDGNNRLGDPDYRVIPSDWEILSQTHPEFADWAQNGRGVDNLIAWGSSIHEIARDNPYTGFHNPLVNWISWNTPNIWDIDCDYERNPAYPTYIFDFEQHHYTQGRNYDDTDPVAATTNQVHPFFKDGGIQRPERSDEQLALVTPVVGDIAGARLIGGHTANIVRFEFSGFNAPITMDNAPPSFEVFIDGALTHFTFYNYNETAPGIATIDLRLEWPVDTKAEVSVSLRPVGAELTLDAFVTKLNGNKNDLTITVVEVLSYGKTNIYKQTFSINNNAAGTYQVGPYRIYCDTKGNVQIRELYVVK